MGLGKVVQACLYYLLTAIGWIFNPISTFILSLWYDKSATVIPLVEDDILLCSGTVLADKIRSREVKAEYAMEKFIARVEEVKESLNAVVATCYDEALSAARQLDKELDMNPGDSRFSKENMPLLGVPLSVKEAFGVKGMPNSGGLVSRASYRADADAVVVQRLKKTGAIPYCLTNISELCMWYESANWLYGRTCNPYNTARIVGGSSGGEACNIASGGAVIGIGSDIGGSIRMPSFFNGIFGHKPSRGFVPNDGQFPMATGSDADLMVSGPMCRYIEDIMPMLKIMAGPDNKQVDLDKKVDIEKLCVYNIVDDGGSLFISPVDQQLKDAQAKVIQYLEKTAGATVKTVGIPKFKYALDMWAAKMTNTGGKSFCEYMEDDGPKITPLFELLKWLIGCSKHTLPAIALAVVEQFEHHLEGINERTLQSFNRMEQELDNLLDENAVLIYPSHPKIAPYHNEPLLHPFNFAYTGLFNALGYPVTQVPLGLSQQGLPLGVQIVAGMNYDRLTIAVAQELAKGGVAKWVNPGKGRHE